MKVPISWLKDFVDIKLAPQELAERLTLAGLEVESLTQVGELWDRDRIFVGQVLKVERHPEAERLVLTTVDYGATQPLTVVTGAPNMYPFVGQDLSSGRGPKVALAIEGARLVDGHSDEYRVIKLKPSKLRGIMSEGMVCSEKELGLSDAHEGNLILPDDAPVGMPLVDYLGDWILEFDIKGAFGHLQSVYGIAREVAALTEQSLRTQVMTILKREPVSIVPDADFAAIVIEAPDLCLRYSAALIEGLAIGPAPFWMQQRLLRAGMRPINNIVDVTNYVMLELGQPLHAFDYDLLVGRANGRPSIIMRRAHPGEHLTTLDGVDRALDPDMLMITDTAGTIAVAGVMGGAETEVNDHTTRVLLEGANFNFLSIRRTSQLLKLNSEAASRLGKGVDPELTVDALARAGELLGQAAGGSVRPVYGDVYPGRKPPRAIDLDPRYVDRLLGIQIPVAEMIRILRALEFTIEDQAPLARGGGQLMHSGDRGEDHPRLLHVTVPSHRLDVSIPADLVEEIGRVYGYDRLPVTLLSDALPEQRHNLSLEGEEAVRDLLVGCGLDEIITYSMIDIVEDAQLATQPAAPDASAYVAIRNPLSADRAHLRRRLLPAVVTTARANLRFQERVAIFEIGRVFMPNPDGGLPAEPRRLAVVMTGVREPKTWLPHDETPMDFFDLKGVVETLLERLNVCGVTWEQGSHPAMHPGRTARLLIDGVDVGAVGEMHPRVRAGFDLPDQPVALMEVDLDAVLAGWGKSAGEMHDISAQPAVYEDMAIIVDEAVTAAQVADLIRQSGGKLLVDLQLFDIYQGQPIPQGKKSLAYALTFQAPDRTLVDDDVRKQRVRIINRLERELGAVLRS
ncbi:MAG TPA: phenylalanine--tRNA ligase subunit beta [Anaerolineae bacterium]